MTIARIALAELLEKGPDADLVCEMLGFMAQRLINEARASSLGRGRSASIGWSR